MILRFSIGNFRSFEEITYLEMNIEEKNRDISNYYKNHVINTDFNILNSDKKYKLVKTKSLYGAKGNGKKDFLKGLEIFTSIIKNSMEINLLHHIKPFYLTHPSFFQIIFIDNDNMYRYGFKADNEKIHSEWLFVYNKTGRERPIFIIDNYKIYKINDEYIPNNGFNSSFLQTYECNKNKDKLFLSYIKFYNLSNLNKDFFEKILSYSILTDYKDDYADIYNSLKLGGLFIINNIDNKLNPLFIFTVQLLFNSELNNKGSQLIIIRDNIKLFPRDIKLTEEVDYIQNKQGIANIIPFQKYFLNKTF